MKMIFRSTYSSANGTYPAGTAADIPQPLAVALFGAGAAVPVESDDAVILERALAATVTTPETATMPAGETATAARRRGG